MRVLVVVVVHSACQTFHRTPFLHNLLTSRILQSDQKTRNTHSRVTDWEDWFDRATKMVKKGHETLMVSGKLAS